VEHMKIFILSLLSMFASLAFGSAPSGRDLPLTSDETLLRVNRSPGILFEPSDTPTGDQAYLYYELAKEIPDESN